jgi:LysM repeat protein
MPTTKLLAWIGLACVLLLVACGQPVPTTSSSPLTTPIVDFDAPGGSSGEFPPSVYLEPAVLNLAVGETGAVNVWIDGAQGIATLSLELSFEPGAIQVEDADDEAAGVQLAPGDFLQPLQVARNEVTVGEAGRIYYQASQTVGAAGQAGIVATVRLRGVAPGGAPLRFEHVAAHDAAGNGVEILPLSDGLIAVAEGGAATAAPSPPAAGATVVPQDGEGGIYYVVQPGENLFRIGLQFGVSGDAVAAASELGDPDQVSAGSMVLVPVDPPVGRYGYYVQPQDTLYGVADRFGVTADELAALNGMAAGDPLSVGQILVVP